MNSGNGSEAGLLWIVPEGRILFATTRKTGVVDHMAELHTLPEQFWYSNLSRIGCIDVGQVGRGRIILPDDWVGESLERLLTGFHPGQPTDVLRQTSAMLIRVARMSALVSHLLTGSTIRDRFGKRIRRQIFSSPSLRDHLCGVFRTVSETPEPCRDMLSKAIQELSMPQRQAIRDIPDIRPGNLSVFRFPGFAHAMRLAGRSLPCPGGWQRKLARTTLILKRSASLDRLRSIDRPAILFGRFQPTVKHGSQWLGYLTRGACRLFGRKHYTLDEVEQLIGNGQFYLEGLLIGPGWTRAGEILPFGKLLDHLVECCGGAKITGNSLSANLVAINALETTLPDSGRFTNSVQSAWLGAEDRLTLLPAMKLMEKHKARVVSVGAGSIAFLQSCGLVGQDDLARRLRMYGMVEITRRAATTLQDDILPPAHDDQLLSHAMQTKCSECVFSFDELPFVPTRWRSSRFSDMARRYRKRHSPTP